MRFARSHFPRGFTFGAASSAYQIEGHDAGGAGPTHWDTFAATPGNVAHGHNGARACDHYHRCPEDLDLLAAAGFDAYRFSTSWARVLPEGRGAPNPDGLDFYDRLTDAICERGLAPHVTLYHWELPAALADLGGWRNRDIAGWFADFTALVMGRIGDRVASVAPVNEPWCVSWLGHFLGQHAPGLRDIRAAARAMHHVLLAHGRAIEVMRAMGLSNLGAVVNQEWAQPADDSPEARAATDLYDGYYNRFFLEAMFHARYPANVLAGLEPHLPHGWEEGFDVIAAPLDWCGVNYYTRSIIAPNEGPWPGHHTIKGPLETTAMGWEIYPQGLSDLLQRIAAEYTGDLPLVVTENGMASDEGQQDIGRIAYLDAHLAAARAALDRGVPLAGYFVWSLLDNFEWACGYDARFGLVNVAYDTQERTPKASYHALADALRR
ncbi:MAG: GH1 family beta-glucosidase [Marinibacterium sp.]|nr:GH1 family beta-glucosidase [Marinibacterium sp.]